MIFTHVLGGGLVVGLEFALELDVEVDGDGFAGFLGLLAGGGVEEALE